MKTGLTLTQLSAEIERQAKTKKDYMVPSTAIAMTTNDQGIALGFGSGRSGPVSPFVMPLRPNAHDQLGAYLGIPAPYYRKMLSTAPELLAKNVNEWLSRSTSGDRRMVRTLDGSVRAFLSDRYQRIDNYSVADAALPILRDVGLEIKSCEITESHLYIKGSAPSVVAEVKGSKRVGDLVEAGVMISNSEIGFGRLTVKPFYNFLWCLNGMVRDSIMARAHIGRKIDETEGLLSDSTKRAEDDVVLMKLRDVIRSAMDAARFQADIDRMVEAVRQPIEGSPVGAIEELSDGFLSASEGSLVLRHLVEGGDLSRFGLMNAVTRTAADVDSYDRSTEIETFGGSVIDLSDRDWQRIATAAA